MRKALIEIQSVFSELEKSRLVSKLRRAREARKTQSFLERFHRTLLDECLHIQGRKTWYEDIQQFQATIDSFLHSYNSQRPHQGRGMKGKTPFDAFTWGIPSNPTLDSNKSAP